MKTLLLVLGVGIAMSTAPHAQDLSVPERLTLDDVIRLADARNPTLAAARQSIAIAEAQRLDATQRLNPAVSIESEGFPLFGSDRPSFFDNQQFTVRVDQEIELGGRRDLRTQVAQAATDAATARVQDTRRRLLLDVRTAYFRLVLAATNREVAQTSLVEIDQVIGLSQIRFESGEISGAEFRRLQVERLTFADEVFAAELAERNARSILLALLNVPDLTRRLQPSEPLLPSADQLARVDQVVATSLAVRDLARLQSEALFNHPEMDVARAELRRVGTQTRLQRALRTPNITVAGGYQRNFGANAVVFGVTVPLPVFDKNRGGIARAEAERRVVEYGATAAEIQVRLELQLAINAVEVNRDRVRYIEDEYLGTAREARGIVLASYELGAANLIDFLDAERTFRGTQRTYNQALFDLRVSLFQLEAALGLSVDSLRDLP